MATTSSPNGAGLTAQTATIHTAQVEIRALQVGKKQVTLAMLGFQEQLSENVR